MVAVPVVAALVGACGPIQGPAPTLLFDGRFESAGVGPATLGGTAAIVAEERLAQVGISVTGGPPNATIGWFARNGTCSGSGEPMGPYNAYPPLTLSEEGSGSRTVTIHRRFGDAAYAIELVTNTDGTGAQIGCANLTQ